MNWKDDVFTLDNLLHAIIAVAFTLILGSLLPWPFLYAALASVGLYLREASQVKWDFTLKWSAHKHLEWSVGTLAAFIAAGFLTLFS